MSSVLGRQRKIEGRTLWSDSKTVLCWLRNRREWKQFVKHRVNEILEISEFENWKYCPSEDNPSDIGSRDMMASELDGSHLWWNGPSWLVKVESFRPRQELVTDTEESENERVKSMVTITVANDEGLESIMDVTRYGTEWKLYRVTAWVVRFVWSIRAILRGKQEDNQQIPPH